MPSKNKLMVATLLIGAFCIFFDQAMLAPAFPSIMRHFSVQASTVQWLQSTYTLAMAVVVPANAFLISRFNLRKLFVGAIFLFAAGSLVATLAPAFFILLAARIVQGLMGGAIMPTVMTSVVLLFPKEKRGSATGIIAVVISSSIAIGPAASGLIVDVVGWRGLYVLLTVFALAIGLIALAIVFDNIDYERVPLDAPSAILMASGMASLLFGASSIASAGMPAISVCTIIVGAILIIVFIRRQRRLEYPFLKMSIMADTVLGPACFIMGLANASLICTEAVFPLFIQDVMGHSAFVSGITILPGVAIGLPFAMLAGKVFDKRGIFPLALIGGLLMVAGAVPLLFYTPVTSIVLLCVLFIVMEIAGQQLFSPSQAWGLSSLDTAELPHGSALFSTIEQLCSSFCVAIVMSLTTLPGTSAGKATFAGVHLGFIACFAIVVVMMLLIFAFTCGKRACGKG